MDTIYATATPPGRSGIAVIRVSGPGAFDVGERIAGPLPRPHRAALRRIRDAQGVVIDEALVLVFGEGQSYTSEPTLELQCHGSPAVVAALLGLLRGQEGLRPAEAGEFTRRALLNGRLDLTQVEGLADLLAAETDLQRRAAWDVFSGKASRTVQGWRDGLLHALAHLEAAIDFSDQDLPEEVTTDVRRTVRRVADEVQTHLGNISANERVRDGFTVAVCGPPNAGKSTLINHLVGRRAAITSPLPGTTRDVLEFRLDLEGLPVTLLDTAGLREAMDPLERIGIENARSRISDADVRIVLRDPHHEHPDLSLDPNDILVWGKADTHDRRPAVSGHTGDGVAELLTKVAHRIQGRLPADSQFNRHRHGVVLSAASMALQAAVEETHGDDVLAHHMWTAVGHLGRLTGHIDIEDVLGDIFSEFCIGK